MSIELKKKNLIKAAKLIKVQPLHCMPNCTTHACLAIKDVTNYYIGDWEKRDMLVQEYSEFMWGHFVAGEQFGTHSEPENQLARQLSLLLFAESLED